MLLILDTRQTRSFKREFADALKAAFPIPSALALSRLASGMDPRGSAMINL